MGTRNSRPASRSVNVETRTGNQARLPELWGAVLRLEPDADHLSGLPGRLSGDAAARRAAASALSRSKPRKVVVEPEVEAGVLEVAEVISLEEVEEAGAEAAIEEDEEIVDLGDDAPEIPAGDDDNAFLEEEEEGEADVTGIVGTPGEET